MKDTNFIGPVPCYTRKLYGRFRWQIILRGPNPVPLLQGLPLRGWIVEVDPESAIMKGRIFLKLKSRGTQTSELSELSCNTGINMAQRHELISWDEVSKLC